MTIEANRIIERPLTALSELPLNDLGILWMLFGGSIFFNKRQFAARLSSQLESLR